MKTPVFLKSMIFLSLLIGGIAFQIYYVDGITTFENTSGEMIYGSRLSCIEMSRDLNFAQTGICKPKTAYSLRIGNLEYFFLKHLGEGHFVFSCEFNGEIKSLDWGYYTNSMSDFYRYHEWPNCAAFSESLGSESTKSQ